MTTRVSKDISEDQSGKAKGQLELALRKRGVGALVALPGGMESSIGKARVKCGPRNLGAIDYRLEVGVSGQASLVKFDRRPNAQDGETLHLTLADGRMLDCQVIDSSPYCAVVGDGPYLDRRTTNR